MRTEIEFSPSYSLLTVTLDPGETVRAEPGAMVAQQGVDLQTGVARRRLRSRPPGPGRRVLPDELLHRRNPRWLGLPGSPSPGDIRSFQVLPGSDLFIQSGSFLACTGGVQVDSRFQGFRGFFGGERFFFLWAFTGDEPGEVFYNSYGAIRKFVLEPGRELAVDTGDLAAFTRGVEYSIGRVGGLRSLALGGEGLVMRLRAGSGGRGWVQTRNLDSLGERIVSFIPKKSWRNPPECGSSPGPAGAGSLPISPGGPGAPGLGRSPAR